MKIKKLQIRNYKNLDADLTHESDLIAFIGNNGSGKSNLLEAISHIFRSLFKSAYKVDFDYTIEYETSKLSQVKIEKKGSQRNFFLNGKTIIDITPYLPQKVIAIYSGEESRLFNECYGPFYLEFVRNINKAQIQGTEYSDLPKMLYLNKFYWHLSLLTLLVSDLEDNQKFVKDVLKIEKVDKIKIDFLSSNYEEYNDNQALRLVKDIDGKSEYELDEFKELLVNKGYTAYDVYKYLYLAFTPDKSKIIKDIVVKFNSNLTIADLSEGEKKLLLIKGALEFAGQEDSIFILDEPDAHIHINNKEQITNSFKDYLHNRQIIITTHSPTLTQCVKDENVYMLNSGKIEDRNRQEIIQEVTGEFWNKHQQSSFISSKKPIILLVEGKHDKEHINNAFEVFKEDFESMDFEIFKLNSETNILPFMRGLYESDFDNTKLYIGLFDREKKILDDFKNPKNYAKIDGKEYYKVLENKKPNTNYFVTALPELEDKKCDCSIEMMYDYLKWEEAYKEAVENTLGKTSDKSIKKYSEDVLNDAKNILSENSKNFSREDFKNFRKLFDLIKEIMEYSASQNAPKKQSKPIEPVSPPIINPTIKNDKEIIEIYSIRKEANLVGIYNKKTKNVTILPGSIISATVAPSYKIKYNPIRNKLIKKYCELNDNKWVVKAPIQFSSPSGALKFGFGAINNGWKSWLLKENNAELDSIRTKNI